MTRLVPAWLYLFYFLVVVRNRHSRDAIMGAKLTAWKILEATEAPLQRLARTYSNKIYGAFYVAAKIVSTDTY